MAVALRDAIEKVVPDAEVFLDQSNLQPGQEWASALSREIRECDTFVILVGAQKGVWQDREYREALERQANDKDFLLLPIVTVDRSRVADFHFLRQYHWIEATDPTVPEAIDRIRTALERQQAGRAERKAAELWRGEHPFRGLAALEERDAKFFFGRARETEDILDRLSRARGRLITLIGNSGVGKSSLVRAGVMAALKSGTLKGDTLFPRGLRDTDQWAYLTMNPGQDPIEGIVREFFSQWDLDPLDPQKSRFREGWADGLRDGKLTLGGLIDATDEHLVKTKGAAPASYVLYIDQGEELYTRTRQVVDRFSKVLADGLRLRPEKLLVIMSFRSDYYGHLQGNDALFDLVEKVDVRPLSPDQLLHALSEPVRLLGAKFDNPKMVQQLVGSVGRDADVLPLIADLFQDLWDRMLKRDDGVLSFADHPEAIHVDFALKRRAERFLSDNPDKVEAVKRLFTLRLARWLSGSDEPVRDYMVRDADSPAGQKEWALVEALAGPDMRLLVTGERDGQSRAWVAHEVLLRKWDKLVEWFNDEREFLVWKGEAEEKLRRHAAASRLEKVKTLLMGFDLDMARKWRGSRSDDIHPDLMGFIDESLQFAGRTQRKRQQLQLSALALLSLVVIGLLAFLNEQVLSRFWFKVSNVHAKSLEDIRGMKDLEHFRDCGGDVREASSRREDYSSDCPEMVIIPAGTFMMGSPSNEEGRSENWEGIKSGNNTKPFEVSVSRFAISRFEITGDQWSRCVELGGCEAGAAAEGDRPVTSVSWERAQRYVRWLSEMTGYDYRLPTEREFEYATRAGTKAAVYWKPDDNQWKPDDDQEICSYANVADAKAREYYGWRATASCNDESTGVAKIGKYKPNKWGLHDMLGNVREWVEDCFQAPYRDPESPHRQGEQNQCPGGLRAVRGGGWSSPPKDVRSAARWRAEQKIDGIDSTIGFRVVRDLQ